MLAFAMQQMKTKCRSGIMSTSIILLVLVFASNFESLVLVCVLSNCLLVLVNFELLVLTYASACACVPNENQT